MRKSEKEEQLSPNLSRDIDLVLAGKYNKNDDVKIRENTPEILIKNGVKDLPMLMNQSHLRTNIISSNKAKKLGIYTEHTNYHNIGKELFVKAIINMDKPIAIIKSISKTGKDKTYIIITEVQNKRGEQIIIPIYINTKGNYNNISIETNKIKTVYGKRNIKEFVDRTIKKDIKNVIYLTKDKRKRRLITTLELHLPNQSN